MLLQMGEPNIQLLLLLCLESSFRPQKKSSTCFMLNHAFEFVHLQRDWGIYIYILCIIIYVYIYLYIQMSTRWNFLLDWWLARIYRTLLAAGAEDIQLTEVPGKVDMAEGWDGWKVAWHATGSPGSPGELSYQMWFLYVVVVWFLVDFWAFSQVSRFSRVL